MTEERRKRRGRPPAPGKDPGPLARRVKALREARTLTQEELATLAGVDRAVVAKIEDGQRRTPRAATVAALARGLKVTPEDLRRDIYGG
jgi:transcriptional regulator with XRE-family HTH domain